MRPSCCAVSNERDVETKLHSDACCGFKTGVGQETYADDLFLAEPLEFVFEIGVRKSA